MKILYWSPYVGHVGTIKAVINSAAAMRKYGGHEVKIIKNHTEWEGYEERIKDSRVEIIDFGLKKWLPNLHHLSLVGSRVYMITVAFFGFFQLMICLKREKPEVLITNLIAVPAILATRLMHNRPKIIASIQGFPKFLGVSCRTDYPLWMKIEDAIRKRLWNLVYVHADLIVCMTTSTREKLIEQTTLPAEIFTVINNPIVDDEILIKSDEEVEDSWLFSNETKCVIAIGRLTKQKDFLSLVKAIDLVGNQLPIRVAILGEGEEHSKLEEEIKMRKLGDRVRLYGFVSNPYAYLKNADLFVLTSRWEDPGHAILEAAALRIPIVSTNCPSGPADLLAYGEGGELCPVGDVNCLAEKIISSLRASDQSTKIQIAYDNANKFSLQAHFNKFKPYLDEWEGKIIHES